MSGQPDIDIRENYIKCLDAELLSILLKDRSSGKNIIWATDIYASKGASYDSPEAITVKLITGRFGKIIRPRIDKSQEEQKIRIKDKAEVFTPSWICNEMNNHLCDEWFEKKDVFNTAKDKTWIVDNNKIPFTNEKDKTWQDFVKLKVLEISCGEAPFLASRYDITTGKWIDVNSRIGALDRKLRVINENCDSEQEWYNWTLVAFQSTFGYEWQGDSLLIARENLLFTFIDYYIAKFGMFPIKEYLIEIAKILSWNIWQMDGLKDVIPNSCKPIQKRQMSLFEDEETEPCLGCAKNDNSKHTGIYCKIINWETKRSIKFFKGEKRMKFDFVIGNPPYQENDGSGASTDAAMPLYNRFVTEAKKITNDCMSMIIPSKWMVGGRGLNKFREETINDLHFKKINDFVDASFCFPGLHIDGGVCYFIWDRNYYGEINYCYIDEYGHKNYSKRFLKNQYTDKVIRNINNVKILEKVYFDNKFADIVSYTQPYGIRKDLFNSPEKYAKYNLSNIPFPNSYKVYGVKGIKGGAKRTTGYIDAKAMIKGVDSIDKYKIFFTTSYSSNAVIPPEEILGDKNEICTETFLLIGPFDNMESRNNCSKYIHTNFFRILLFMGKGTMQVSKSVFELIPLQDFTDKSDIDWSKSIHEIDLQLYKKYGLDQNEIDFIESHIKEMK